jgi:hypothetical protein
MTLTDADRRRSLENERSEILLRIADWSHRIEKAGRATPGDYIFPPLAGCAIGMPLFGALMIFAVRNVDPDAPPPYLHHMPLLVIVFIVAIGGVTFLVRRRMRAARVAEMRRAHDMAIGTFQLRLREIDRLLRELGPG